MKNAARQVEDSVGGVCDVAAETFMDEIPNAIIGFFDPFTRSRETDEEPRDEVELDGDDECGEDECCDDEYAEGEEDDEEDEDGDDSEEDDEEEDDALLRTRCVSLQLNGERIAYVLHPGQPDPLAELAADPFEMLSLWAAGAFSNGLQAFINEQIDESMGDNPVEADEDGYPEKVYFGAGMPNELTREVLDHCALSPRVSLEERCLCGLRLDGIDTRPWRSVDLLPGRNEDDLAYARRFLAAPGILNASEVDHYAMLVACWHDLF